MLTALLSRTLLLSWAVWLGGLIGVFVAVTMIFSGLAPDRALAGTVAAGVFGRFERLMLVAAALSLLSALGLVLARKSALRITVLALLLLAAAGALTSRLVISPRIEALRQQGQTQTPAFRSLHGTSMTVYVSLTGLLALTGLLLPAAIRPPPPLRPD